MAKDTKTRVREARDMLRKLNTPEFRNREQQVGKNYDEQRDKLADYIMKPVGAAMATREVMPSMETSFQSTAPNARVGMFYTGEDKQGNPKLQDVPDVLRNKGYDLSVSVDLSTSTLEVDTPFQKWRRKSGVEDMEENVARRQFVASTTGFDPKRDTGAVSNNVLAYKRYTGEYERYAGSGLARSGLGAALSWQIQSRMNDKDLATLADPEQATGSVLNSTYRLIRNTDTAKIVPNAIRTDRVSAVNFLDQIARQRKEGAMDDAEAIQSLRQRFAISDSAHAGRLLVLLGESYDFEVGGKDRETTSRAYRWWQSVSGESQFQQNPEAVMDTYNAITTATEVRSGRFKIRR